MENLPPLQNATAHGPTEAMTTAHKKGTTGGSILSRLSFLRNNESRSSIEEPRAQQPEPASAAATINYNGHSETISVVPVADRPTRALAAAMSQQKTRRRRGSLRKMALLGRGAAREKRDLKELKPPPPQPQQQQLPRSLAIDTSQILLQQTTVPPPIQQQQQQPPYSSASGALADSPIIGLGLSNAEPRLSVEDFAKPLDPTSTAGHDTQVTSPTISYTSTDEDEGLSMAKQMPVSSQPGGAPFTSGSESYYRNTSPHGSALRPTMSLQRRRSSSKQQYAKSPLSLQGLAGGSPALANIDSGHHDYSETEWWGWVVLIVTWSVFVIGMGSCLNAWSWAWDVGSTPYAPPELEDDPTLPIVGYYPALMILTCIMAWVWVIVAWVGMKYFRHAKITGD
ncbi:hypothetical protein F4808DRAFT_425927 [Astrocystis sublimbata]|nr:hypothetical protein F4808DRAFT_425927 [Astrocystis sublimbata]